MDIKWSGEGVNEVGSLDGRDAIFIDEKYFRPAEVETLLGDASKAQKELGWVPRISFGELVSEMVHEDLKAAKQEVLLKQNSL